MISCLIGQRQLCYNLLQSSMGKRGLQKQFDPLGRYCREVKENSEESGGTQVGVGFRKSEFEVFNNFGASLPSIPQGTDSGDDVLQGRHW